MLLERHDLGAPAALVAEIRALAPQAPSVAAAVSEIIAAVAAEGDAAVRRYTARFDADPPPPARVEADELAHALAVLDPAVRAGLEVAIANVAEVAWAAADDDREVTLAQGQRVLLREMPVARAAVYVPGGRAPYPSTVVMGAVTARAAGVADVAIVTPPPIDPVTSLSSILAKALSVRDTLQPPVLTATRISAITAPAGPIADRPTRHHVLYRASL